MINIQNLDQDIGNLRFKNNIIEWTSKAEYVFLDIPDLGKKRALQYIIETYGYLGLTLLHHSPRGSLDGSNWINLRPLQTEGVAYKNSFWNSCRWWRCYYS